MSQLLTHSVDITDGKYVIKTYLDGKIDAVYRPTDKERAVVDMAALINGFLPPRHLDRQDIQTR